VKKVMAKSQNQKKGGGAKKIGRNKLRCQKYKNENRYEKNKKRKALKEARQQNKNK
jgi:hypothetical protein